MIPGVLLGPGGYGAPDHGTSSDKNSVMSELLSRKFRQVQQKPTVRWKWHVQDWAWACLCHLPQSQFLYLSSWLCGEGPYVQLTGEGKVWTWFMDGYMLKMVYCCTNSYSRVALKERHRGNLPSGQSFCRCISHPHSVERDVHIGLYMDMDNGGCLLVFQELGGRKIRILETGIFGE